ncbi:MAG: tRNA (cytidine(34)-2'-O)-methyltransferase [Pseudomonadota bacterium]
MFHLVLCQPQIPQNTGNIIRLCANTGCTLHLIRPLGFALTDKYLKRAGLDYHHLSKLVVHNCFDDFRANVSTQRIFAIETCGTKNYDTICYQTGDTFLFGSETRGLNDTILAGIDQANLIKIPMRADNRSLNLSNAVAIVTYEAWRQHGFQ